MTTFMEFLWKFLPAVLLVPFITFFLGRLGNNADRKLEYRTFVEVETIKAGYKLRNLSNIKKGTKLMLPKQFLSLEALIENKLKQEQSFNWINHLIYVRISTFGKSIITSGTVRIKLTNNENKEESWNLDISLPILEVTEQVYIPVDSLELLDVPFYISEVIVSYRTQAGENIRYESKSDRVENGEVVTKVSHKVKKFLFFYFAIDKNNGRNAEYIILHKDRE